MDRHEILGNALLAVGPDATEMMGAAKRKQHDAGITATLDAGRHRGLPHRTSIAATTVEDHDCAVVLDE